MKILSIYFGDAKGGYGKRLYRLFNDLLDNGDTVIFLSSHRPDIRHDGFFVKLIKVPFQISGGIFFWSFFIFKCVFYSFFISRKHNIDKIVSFGPFYTALSILPVCFLKKDAITFIRADNMKHGSNPLRNLFFYWIDRIGIIISKLVVFNSATVKKVYMARYGINEQKTAILPNNVDTVYQRDDIKKTLVRKEYGFLEDDFVLSSMGVLNEDKNFSFLISAMQHIREPKVRLILIGDDVAATGEKRRLMEMADQMGLRNRIVFCGWQTEPKPILAASDLFVFPSKHEGSPNALLEALSCGIPCLGSRIDEIAEVLEYDELLFPLDNPKLLAEKIFGAQSDHVYYKKIKRMSYERLNRFLFNWDQEVLDIVHQS
jgi:glycosyltransferase involved in cell wall biosynthesis